ncbi:hypothetical protein ACIQWL_37465 [Streptomyces mirabilis]|uniref:hypothetical protein n=1 Tax=Streptomyces mirabilis TaxID=68239 RepID=UPI00380D56F4
MRTLTGQAAHIAASALHAQPDGARYLHELVDDRHIDLEICSAIRAACTMPGRG